MLSLFSLLGATYGRESGLIHILPPPVLPLSPEDHRLNHCIKWRDINLYESHEKADMKLIHSRDIDTLRPLLSMIGKVWNVRTAHGSMNIT